MLWKPSALQQFVEPCIRDLQIVLCQLLQARPAFIATPRSPSRTQGESQGHVGKAGEDQVGNKGLLDRLERLPGLIDTREVSFSIQGFCQPEFG